MAPVARRTVGRYPVVHIGSDPKELDLLDLLKAATGNDVAGFAITASGQTLPVQERISVLTDAGGHIGWCSQSPLPSSFTAFLRRIFQKA
jgi:hypothetical protein